MADSCARPRIPLINRAGGLLFWVSVFGRVHEEGGIVTVLNDVPLVSAESSGTRGRVAELHEIRAQALAGPSEKATRAQHAKGKLTARERIELLLDAGSFREVEQLRRHRATGFGLEEKKPYSDGVITGWGTVEGRTVFVYAHDFRIFGGALGEAHATKIHKIMDMAIAAGAPLVSLNDGAGARIQEGVSALAGLRRDLPAQHQGVGCDPADLGDAGPVRGRCGLQSGADGLRVHGAGHLADVHHRPGRGQGGHGRGDHPERPGRRGRARRDERCVPLRLRRRGDLHRRGALPVVAAPAEQPGVPARRPLRGSPNPARRRADRSGAGRTATVRTTWRR